MYMWELNILKVPWGYWKYLEGTRMLLIINKKTSACVGSYISKFPWIRQINKSLELNRLILLITFDGWLIIETLECF